MLLLTFPDGDDNAVNIAGYVQAVSVSFGYKVKLMPISKVRIEQKRRFLSFRKKGIVPKRVLYIAYSKFNKRHFSKLRDLNAYAIVSSDIYRKFHNDIHEVIEPFRVIYVQNPEIKDDILDDFFDWWKEFMNGIDRIMSNFKENAEFKAVSIITYLVFLLKEVDKEISEVFKPCLKQQIP